MKTYVKVDANGVVTECMAGAASAELLMVDHLVFPIRFFNDVAKGDVYKNGTFIKKPAPTKDVWITVRQRRDALITNTDWTQMADSPLTATQKTAWQTYRQALRDITTQPVPTNITWPTTPGGI